MAKTNWGIGDTVRPADMNEIGSEINQLREDVDNIEIPPASLTVPGIVQLSDVVNSTDKTKAATANSVKLAYDEATAAKQLGVEQKNNVVAALNGRGQLETEALFHRILQLKTDHIPSQQVIIMGRVW